MPLTMLTQHVGYVTSDELLYLPGFLIIKLKNELNIPYLIRIMINMLM